MKKLIRITALLLVLAHLAMLLVACNPRGTFMGPLGDSYRFSGDRYVYTDSDGVSTKGSYRIEDGFITFSPDGADGSFSLPWEKHSKKSITIGEINYKKK